MLEPIEIKKLTQKEENFIEEKRNEIIQKLKNTPKEGVEVDYLGKKFWVAHGVFWPHEDSKPLVENFVINKGDTVLDVCTGSGVIAIYAALKGASKVTALDINPDSIKTTLENAKRYGVENIIDAKISDVMEAVPKEEKFDVITCNPPFSERKSNNFIESTIKDTGLHVQKEFFNNLSKHLKTGGRVYFSQSNFGNIHDAFKLIDENEFSIKLIGQNILKNDPRIFYAFELKRKI